MKNLLKPIDSATPVALTKADGIANTAVKTLKAIKYPNPLNDIAVVGKKQDWQRSFLLRPKYGGKFLFLLYPKEHPGEKTILRQAVRLNAFNSAPEVVDMTIPPDLRNFQRWEWRLIKLSALEDEESFERFDALEQSDGLMPSLESLNIANHAAREGFFSTLIYDVRSVLYGEIDFEEEHHLANSKMVLWSCHQPYETKEGRAAVKASSLKILSWYQETLMAFSPHMVCMLGDSAYSDGTSSLDFVNQVYNRSGWHSNPSMKQDLLALYRLNYRFHWGFDAMQSVMRCFPHLGMWDDHEIRDGYGSEESDFKETNRMIKQIASQAAQEYLFAYSPRVRDESESNVEVDNHQIYRNRSIATFVFDGRNSRRYGSDPVVPSEVKFLASTLASALVDNYVKTQTGSYLAGKAAGQLVSKITGEILGLFQQQNGRVISDQQLKDFEHFCSALKSQPEVKYLLMGNSVPFIYLLDFVEDFLAESAIAATETAHQLRDDIRDSWHSPGNRAQLTRLIDILRDLHQARNDIEIINLSGDIHISNAFKFQPEGFNKPLYQVTTSAVTNDPPTPDGLFNLLSADGVLHAGTDSKEFGKVQRLWHEGKHQNFLTIEATVGTLILHLHVYDADDKHLTITPGQGYQLEE